MSSDAAKSFLNFLKQQKTGHAGPVVVAVPKGGKRHVDTAGSPTRQQSTDRAPSPRNVNSNNNTSSHTTARRAGSPPAASTAANYRLVQAVNQKEARQDLATRLVLLDEATRRRTVAQDEAAEWLEFQERTVRKGMQRAWAQNVAQGSYFPVEETNEYISGRLPPWAPEASAKAGVIEASSDPSDVPLVQLLRRHSSSDATAAAVVGGGSFSTINNKVALSSSHATATASQLALKETHSAVKARAERVEADTLERDRARAVSYAFQRISQDQQWAYQHQFSDYSIHWMHHSSFRTNSPHRTANGPPPRTTTTTPAWPSSGFAASPPRRDNQNDLWTVQLFEEWKRFYRSWNSKSSSNRRQRGAHTSICMSPSSLLASFLSTILIDDMQSDAFAETLSRHILMQCVEVTNDQAVVLGEEKGDDGLLQQEEDPPITLTGFCYLLKSIAGIVFPDVHIADAVRCLSVVLEERVHRTHY